MSEPAPGTEASAPQPEFLYCPYCRGGNLLDATRCRWCRRALTPPVEAPASPEEPTPPVSLEQVLCPHCQGGNPPDAMRCMWCKRLLNLEALAAAVPPPRNLLDSYRRAVIRPNLLNYAAEVPNASWRKIWISLAIAAIVNSVIGIARMTSWDVTGVSLEVLSSALAILTGFFLNSLLIYGVANMFGGKGRKGIFRADFLLHAYLSVLVFTPVSIVSDTFGLIPSAGTCLASLVGLYQLYLFYMVIQVSRQLDPSSARSAIICYVVVGVILLVAIILVGLALYAAFNLLYSPT